MDILGENDCDGIYKTGLYKEIDYYKNKEEQLKKNGREDIDEILNQYLETVSFTGMNIVGKYNKNIEASGKHKIEREEKHEILLTYNNIFFINGLYCVHKKELSPAVEKELNELNKSEDLKYLEKRVIFFENIEEVNDKIIMSNVGGNFIVFKKDNTDLFFESDLGDELLNKSLLNQFNDKLKIKTSYGSIYWYDLKTKNKSLEEYEDKYSFGGKLIKDKFTTNSYKEDNAKLVLPEFLSIDQFLDSSYFGDVVAKALENDIFRKKTFSQCSEIEDFKKIYEVGGNILLDKSYIIKEKVIFNNVFKLEDISKNIIERILSTKN
ncbi:MAG: hypothetical protein Q9M94_05210 [Candidatus Gracilibacteria bacterium]|nr:hypothetical protein [Candidatus Gracilibacteria bacterium]MDQ7023126.1 hypothetical protein [Candidatus Gracilibacteria bacterium]